MSSSSSEGGSLPSVVFLLIFAVIVMMLVVSNRGFATMGVPADPITIYSQPKSAEVRPSTSRESAPRYPDQTAKYGYQPVVEPNQKTINNQATTPTRIPLPLVPSSNTTPQSINNQATIPAPIYPPLVPPSNTTPQSTNNQATTPARISPSLIPSPETTRPTSGHDCHKMNGFETSSQHIADNFNSMMLRLKEYYEPTLTSHFSHVTTEDPIGLFINMCITLWLNNEPVQSTHNEIGRLFSTPVPRDQTAMLNYYEAYQAIFLYLLYERSVPLFEAVHDKTNVLSYIDDSTTKLWARVIRYSCEKAPNANVSKTDMAEFVSVLKNNVTIEFWLEIWRSHTDTQIPRKHSSAILTNQRQGFLLLFLLRYWQYKAVEEVHRKCCAALINRCGTTLVRQLWLLLQDKLSIVNLKRLHPHMWVILFDLIKTQPAVVFDGVPATTLPPLLADISVKLSMLNKNLTTQLFTGSKRYDDSVVDGFFPQPKSLSANSFSSICQALSNQSIIMLDKGIQVLVTPNQVVKDFQYMQPKSMVDDNFINRRHAVNSDNICYYKFIHRSNDLVGQNNVLYTLNLIDRPLAALRSRLGEEHGSLAFINNEQGEDKLFATSKCRVFYSPEYDALISRQVFSKVVNNLIANTLPLAVHFNCVSVLMGLPTATMPEPLPVLKQTVMMSLLYPYQPDLHRLVENSYLFIRANALIHCGAFPPAFLASVDQNQLANQLNRAPNSDVTAIETWLRLYTMSDRLVTRASQFLAKIANSHRDMDQPAGEEGTENDGLLLLWQLILLHDRIEIRQEFALIWGALLYCTDERLRQQSQHRVSQLCNEQKMTLVRLICGNYLLKRWWHKVEKQSSGTDAAAAMALFNLRHDKAVTLFSEHKINMKDDFERCYPPSDNKRMAFLSAELYQRLITDGLTNEFYDDIKVRMVPFYAYAKNLAIDGFRVRYDQGEAATFTKPNGKIRFYIPVQDGHVRCQLQHVSSQLSLLELDARVPNASFVSFLLSPTNMSVATSGRNPTDLTYTISMFVRYQLTPLDTKSRQGIVSFSTRSPVVRAGDLSEQAMMNIVYRQRGQRDDTLSTVSSETLRSVRPRIGLHRDKGYYYEVPSLDEMSDTLKTMRQQHQLVNDTALTTFHADDELNASLAPLIRLNGNDKGDGIYFVFNGHRFSLPL